MDKDFLFKPHACGFVIDSLFQVLFPSFAPSTFLRFVLRACCPCDIEFHWPCHISHSTTTFLCPIFNNRTSDETSKHPKPQALRTHQASKTTLTMAFLRHANHSPFAAQPNQPTTNPASHPAAAPASSSPWHQQPAPSPCFPGARRRASSGIRSRAICMLGRRGLVSFLPIFF